MYSYKIQIKKVSGRLNESALPKKSLVIRSKEEKKMNQLFEEADEYLQKTYGLSLESADINPITPAEPAGISAEGLRAKIEATPVRSAWSRGVKTYALEMVDSLEEYNGGEMPQSVSELKQWLLNGAQDWKQASEGGSWLINDEQIAQRLCGPSELKKVAGGKRRPNARETWLEVQARALYQAAKLVMDAAR